MTGADRQTERRVVDALERVAHGATLSIIGIVFERVVGFLTTAALTTGAGVAAYGAYALAGRLRQVFVSLSSSVTAGFPRFVPTADDRQERDAVIGFGTLLVVAVATGFGAALFLAAPRVATLTDRGPTFARYLELFALGLPATAWFSATNSLLRAFEAVTATTVSRRLVWPLGQLGVVVVGLELFGSLTAVLVGSLAVSAAVGVGVAGWLAVTEEIRPRLRVPGAGGVSRRYLGYVAPLFLAGAAYTVQQFGFYPLIAWFLSDTAATAFVVGTLLAGFVRLPLTGTNQFVSPVIASLHDAGHDAALARTYRVTSRLVTVGATAVLVPLVVFRRTVLSVFGPELLAYAPLLPAFLLAQYAAVVAGSVGLLLTMTDHERASTVINAGVTVVLAAVAVPVTARAGFVGVVGLYLGMTVLNNGAEVVGLYALEGYQPLTRRHTLPVLAGVPFAAVGVTARGLLPDTVGAVVGTLAGLGVYAGLLWWVGFTRVERRLGETILSRYRAAIGGSVG